MALSHCHGNVSWKRWYHSSSASKDREWNIRKASAALVPNGVKLRRHPGEDTVVGPRSFSLYASTKRDAAAAARLRMGEIADMDKQLNYRSYYTRYSNC